METAHAFQSDTSSMPMIAVEASVISPMAIAHHSSAHLIWYLGGNIRPLSCYRIPHGREWPLACSVDNPCPVWHVRWPLAYKKAGVELAARRNDGRAAQLFVYQLLYFFFRHGPGIVRLRNNERT